MYAILVSLGLGFAWGARLPRPVTCDTLVGGPASRVITSLVHRYHADASVVRGRAGLGEILRSTPVGAQRRLHVRTKAFTLTGAVRRRGDNLDLFITDIDSTERAARVTQAYDPALAKIVVVVTLALADAHTADPTLRGARISGVAIINDRLQRRLVALGFTPAPEAHLIDDLKIFVLESAVALERFVTFD